MKVSGITGKLLVFIFWMAIWYGVFVIVGRDLYVPSPFAVFNKLSELMFLASFWQAVFHSLGRVVLGISLSIALGVVLGVGAALIKPLNAVLEPLVSAVRATPVLSFIILALIWFSSNMVPVFICVLMCFPIIWTNVVQGVRGVDRQLLEMVEVYNVSRIAVLRSLYLPSVRPFFVAGTVTALGLGWKVSVAAEILSNPRYGIGSNIYGAKVYIDTVELFAWTAVIIMLSMLFEKIFSRLLHRNEV